MIRYSSLWQVAVTLLFLLLASVSLAQVDTSYVYKTNTPYGTLDIRTAKSATRYYYLQENKTISFRESSPGVKTNTFRDMTSWDSNPYTQGNLRERNGNADYFILNYRLLFPLGYKNSYGNGYPLIVMLHGMGERGNCWSNSCYHADRNWKPTTNNPPAPTDATSQLLNNDHNLLHGGKVHLDARNLAGSRLPDDPSLPARSFPGLVVFPQNLNGWSGYNVQDAIKLVRLLVKKYNIDENRIYIHGLSNGGTAVYEAIKRAPWLFAAALPMSSPGDGGIISKNLTTTTAHIPLWIFQGGLDTSPTPARTEGYIKKFRDAGALVRYSLYSNLGHGTWNTAYNEQDFFTWMLAKNKSDIHTFGGGTGICMTTKQGVRMELAKGFRAYQWERNGVIISGANGSSYVANTTGTYRARFSRVPNPTSGDWNKWSDAITVTQQNPEQAVIEQQGTVLLKDLNYYNKAHLKAAGESAHYYWYKNGVLMNLPGSMDDAARSIVIYSGDCSTGKCAGNGIYTLVTSGSDHCPSPVSIPKYVYFSNQAPINITAPTGFTGQAISMTSIRLLWNDVSTNEGGFEIWSRKVTGSSYSKWEMRTLTNANVGIFTDAGLVPSTTYHYKIRAVSNNGISNYTPSASGAYLVIKTTSDTSAPSAPQNLTASETGINTIKLSWKASIDDSGIKQYQIFYNSKSIPTASTATTFTINDLALNTTYSFTVKAEDLAGNLSPASNSATGDTYVNGLYYEHSTGAWQSIDNINWSKAEFRGHVTNFTLSPRTQEDFFNFKFDGYLYILKNGSYQFRTTSSDGSRVELNNVVVVNNNGLHDNKTVTGPLQTLSAGAKRIIVKFFEYTGIQNLIVEYKGPDTNYAWIKIPDQALNSGIPSSGTMVAAASATEESILLAEDTSATDDTSLNVYPNPATQNDLNVQLVTDKRTVVRIINFSGAEIYRGEYQPEEITEGIRILSSETFIDGLYIIIVSQGDRIIRKRISIKN